MLYAYKKILGTEEFILEAWDHQRNSHEIAVLSRL